MTTRAPDLGPAGQELWTTIQREHNLRGSGEIAILTQVCKAIDDVDRYGAIIARDGPIIQTKSGPRDHPLIRHQLAARALIARLLLRLGIVKEAKNPVGRPPRSIGVTVEQLREIEELYNEN